VYLSKAAETAYEGFYKRAAEAKKRGDPTNAHCTAMRMIDEAIDEIIPRDPFNKTYALKGVLSGIFRIQKGRLRICWIGSSRLRRVAIIFISETLRKAGDVSDPYRILTKALKSGEYNEEFEKLGLDSPLRDHIRNHRLVPTWSH
jgi:hypothetical protein